MADTNTQGRPTHAKVDADNASFLVRIAYQRLGTWDAVADWYGDGHSKTSYNRLAREDRNFYPSQELVDHIEAHLLPPIRKTISIPERHDADVYLVPDGRGSLSVHEVPIAASVAIIPAGARIVAPSKRKRPPYKRPTWAMVRALEAQIDTLKQQIQEIDNDR